MSSYRVINGEKMPRVTSILDVISKPALMGFYAKYGVRANEILRESAERGSSVHQAIDVINSGGTIEQAQFKLVHAAHGYFSGFLEFQKTYSVVPLKKLEKKLVYSTAHNYCGEVDDLCNVIDKTKDLKYENVLLDYKTGKGIYYTHIVQIAAYWNALVEMGEKVNMGAILHMNEFGKYKLLLVDLSKLKDKFEVFLAAKKIHDDINKEENNHE